METSAKSYSAVVVSSEKISQKPHKYCLGLGKVKDIPSYKECIRQEEKIIKKQKEFERLARKERNQYLDMIEMDR